MEYYLSNGMNNDKDSKPPVTAEQLISVLEDLAIYPLSEIEAEPTDQFVVTMLQETGRLLNENASLVEGGVIHAIGELVRNGKTPAIRKGAIENLEACRLSVSRMHGLSGFASQAYLIPAAATVMNEIIDELQTSLKCIDNVNADNTDTGQKILGELEKTIGVIIFSGHDKDGKPLPGTYEALTKTRDFLEESMASHPDPVLRKGEVSLYTDLAQGALIQGRLSFKIIQDALLLSAAGDPSPDVRYNAFRCLENMYGYFIPHNHPRISQLAEEKEAVSAEALDIALSSMAGDTNPVVRRAAINLMHATLPYVEKSQAYRIYESMAELAEKENDWDVLECAAITVYNLERCTSWKDIRPHVDKLYKAFSRAAEQGSSENARLYCRSASLVGTLRVRQKIEIERALHLLQPSRP